MTLRVLHSFDRISASTAAAKGIVMDIAAGGGTPYNSIDSTGGRRGSGAYKSRANAYPALVAFIPPTDVVYVGVAVKFPSGLGNGFFIRLSEKYAIQNHILIGLTTAGAVTVKRTTTLLAQTADAVVTDGTWYYVEVYAKVSDTVGEIEVRLDGVTILSIGPSPAADTRDGGEGVIDNVYLASPATVADCYFDDFYCCDDAGSRNNGFLGDIRVDCYVPAGNGASSGMTGSDGNSTDNYALVDDADHDSDTTYVGSATATTKDTYEVGGMSHDPADILAVQATMIAKRSDVGSRQARLVCRAGGTDYDGSKRHALMQSYTGESEIWETNPYTASPNDWTQTSFNAAEFGVKVAG